MTQLATMFASGTSRRLIAGALGVLTVALNKKFGLDLNDKDLEYIVWIVLGYMGQSAIKDAAVARAEAAGVKAAELVPSLPSNAKLDFLRAQLAEEEARLAAGKEVPK